jgi:predicted secreted protein
MLSGRFGKLAFSSTAGTIDYTGTAPAMTAPTTPAPVETKDTSSWKIDTDTDTVEAAVFGMGGYKTSVAGLMSWSGSVSAVFNLSDTDGQVALRKAAVSGKPIYFAFYVDGTHKYEGNAFVTKMSVDTQASDYIKFDLDLKGDGALCGAI